MLAAYLYSGRCTNTSPSSWAAVSATRGTYYVDSFTSHDRAWGITKLQNAPFGIQCLPRSKIIKHLIPIARRGPSTLVGGHGRGTLGRTTTGTPAAFPVRKRQAG